jgi:hypothetical protein
MANHKLQSNMASGSPAIERDLLCEELGEFVGEMDPQFSALEETRRRNRLHAATCRKRKRAALAEALNAGSTIEQSTESMKLACRNVAASQAALEKAIQMEFGGEGVALIEEQRRQMRTRQEVFAKLQSSMTLG